MKNKVIKGVGKAFKQIGRETVEKLGKESREVLERTISGKELLGLDKEMSSDELKYHKREDEISKQKEIEEIKAKAGISQERGRNVGEEIVQVQKEKEREEEEKEKYIEEEKERRGIEEQQILENSQIEMVSSNPSKQKKSRGSAFSKKKKSQPDQSNMSQTSEFKGKVN